jgi:excisionase family DNA binding protein
MLWSMETHAKDTYSTAQAAKLLRVNDRTIRKMLDRGELDGEREESGAWRVLQTSVHARLEELRRREAEEGREESWESLERLRELEVEVRDLSYRLGRSEARVELTEKAESTMRAERERLIADLERERERADRLQAELDSERRKGLFRKFFGG